jgi:peroxiredoxin
MSEKDPKSRTPLFLILISAGVFLFGAVLIQLLVGGQEKALQSLNIISQPIMLNKAAPQLVLTDLQGNPVSIGDFRGKLILVNNWATWCAPCQNELPELEAYYTSHADQGFVVVAIESGEPANTVASFVRQNKLTFPVWLDLKGFALEAFNNWDLPSSYVIDQQGNLRMSWTGPINRSTLENYITPLMEK